MPPELEFCLSARTTASSGGGGARVMDQQPGAAWLGPMVMVRASVRAALHAELAPGEDTLETYLEGEISARQTVRAALPGHLLQHLLRLALWGGAGGRRRTHLLRAPCRRRSQGLARHNLPPNMAHSLAALRAEARVRGMSAALAGVPWLTTTSHPHATPAAAAAAAPPADGAPAPATASPPPAPPVEIRPAEVSEGGGPRAVAAGVPVVDALGASACLLHAVRVYNSHAWQAGLRDMCEPLALLQHLAETHVLAHASLGKHLPERAVVALAEALWEGRNVLPQLMRFNALTALLRMVLCWAAANKAHAMAASVHGRMGLLVTLMGACDTHIYQHGVATMHVVALGGAAPADGGGGCAAAPATPRDGDAGGSAPPTPPGTPYPMAAAVAGGAAAREPARAAAAAASPPSPAVPPLSPPDHTRPLREALAWSGWVSGQVAGSLRASLQHSAQRLEAMRAASAHLIRAHGHNHPHTLAALAIQADLVLMCAAPPCASEHAARAAEAMRGQVDKMAASPLVAAPGGAQQQQQQPGGGGGGKGREGVEAQGEGAPLAPAFPGIEEAACLAQRVLESVELAALTSAKAGEGAGRAAGRGVGHVAPAAAAAGGGEGVGAAEVHGLLRAAAHAHAVLAAVMARQGCWDAAAGHWRACNDAW